MIIISEFIHPKGLNLIQTSGLPHQYDPDLWQSETFYDTLKEAKALIVRNQTQVNQTLLNHGSSLNVVGRLGVGLDNIDLKTISEKNIGFVDARGANAASVAEYVMAAMLHCARKIFAADADVKQGGWDRAAFGGFELRGKTLGLIGLGDIGLRVARRANAFDIKVLASDPVRHHKEAVIEENHIHLASTEEIFEQSDFISLHAPLLDSTRQMINEASISMMKKGVYILNTARGELIDSLALSKALESGHIAGAVLDVTDPEPLTTDHILNQSPNVWISPHIAGLTEEAQAQVGIQVAEGVLNILKGLK